MKRKKQSLSELKGLLELWLKVYVSYVESDYSESEGSYICWHLLDMIRVDDINVLDKTLIKEDMFTQSKELFSPRFREFISLFDSCGNLNTSGCLFSGAKARIKFMERRIERLEKQIAKLNK